MKGSMKRSAMKSLKPCPFCGYISDMPYTNTSQGTKWGFIYCPDCSAQGPEVRTYYRPREDWLERGIDAWNERMEEE